MRKIDIGRQSGFTLIELIMVIVILGILSAVAVPRFIDFGDKAKLGVVYKLAADITTANANNFAASKLGKGVSIAVDDSCKTAAEKVVQGTLDWGDGSTTTTSMAGALGVNKTCVLTSTDDAATTSNFTITPVTVP